MFFFLIGASQSFYLEQTDRLNVLITELFCCSCKTKCYIFFSMLGTSAQSKTGVLDVYLKKKMGVTLRLKDLAGLYSYFPLN